MLAFSSFVSSSVQHWITSFILRPKYVVAASSACQWLLTSWVVVRVVFFHVLLLLQHVGVAYTGTFGFVGFVVFFTPGIMGESL